MKKLLAVLTLSLIFLGFGAVKAMAEEVYTPPVLHCEEWQVPGWLNDHGDPTSCVSNLACPEMLKGLPCPGDSPTATPSPEPTVSEAPVVVKPEPVKTTQPDPVVSSEPAPSVEEPSEVVTPEPTSVTPVPIPTPVKTVNIPVEADLPAFMEPFPAKAVHTSNKDELAETGGSNALLMLAIGVIVVGGGFFVFDILMKRRN